jgi:hypothetical protein
MSRPRGRKKPQICYLRLGAIKKALCVNRTEFISNLAISFVADS